MSDAVKFHFDVDGADFSSAGAASVMVKKKLRQLGYSPEVIRKVSIAMYEGEINMVIHANGGTADVEVNDEAIVITLSDSGQTRRTAHSGISQNPDPLPNQEQTHPDEF